jgi:hypothetical protein
MNEPRLIRLATITENHNSDRQSSAVALIADCIGCERPCRDYESTLAREKIELEPQLGGTHMFCPEIQCVRIRVSGSFSEPPVSIVNVRELTGVAQLSTKVDALAPNCATGVELVKLEDRLRPVFDALIIWSLSLEAWSEAQELNLSSRAYMDSEIAASARPCESETPHPLSE